MTIDEADVVDLVLPADVVEEPEPEPDVPEVPDVPDVTDVASPGRLTVAWLASAWKAERVLFVAALWLLVRFFGKGGPRDLLLINHHNHPLLAMASLRAVEPDGRRVINHDCVCRCRGRGARYGHEARVETHCTRGVQRDRLAWLRKGGLCDGVVVGCELELHHIADVRLDVVGRV